MARKKIKLAFITNDSQRKATFKKRRKGLIEDVWPNHSGVHRVVEQFRRMPEMEQNKKMMNNESFIRQRTMKANYQLKKQLVENREKDVNMLMYQCLAGRGLQNLMMADLNDLGWMVDQNLKDINKRIDSLKKAPMEQGESSKRVHENAGLQEGKHGMNLGGDEVIHRPQWFNEWMNAPSEQMGFGHGDEVMMPFNNANNNHGNIFHGGFFP
ncbi:hypothetical protein Leryth_008161 [Lithospermum erythrorhizon]|nr:hypothetical protein Leryth_008161 [Lithospermum erythrorhizon]